MSKPRQVPPPCWTQDECHALVLAFRDHYYALGRTTLKAADWEQVAAATAKACPPSLSAPPKTALQCRNKMDKLRMRYRSKKNRAASSPGRYSSTWALFSLFDEMDPDPVPRHLVSSNLVHKNFGRNFEFHGNVASGSDVQSQVCHNSMPQFKFNTNLGGNGNSSFWYEDDDHVDDDDDHSGLPLTTLDGRYPLPPGFRPKSHMSVKKHNFKHGGDYGIDYEGVFIPKTRSDKGFGPARSSGRIDGNFTSNGYCDEFDEVSRSRSKFVKKNGGVGIEKDLGSVGDLASSLRMLGERFVRVEELKMEMAMEIEKKRMEMELKRDKVIIETQQHMVDMLVNALLPEKKRKKANVDSPDS